MDGSEKTSRSPDESMKNASTPEAVSPTSTTSLVADGEVSLIKVKAQAMAIDESTGLWRLIKGNPVCLVGLKRNDQGLYYITGHRITDKQEILNCRIWPSTNYQRGDATFHHWRSNDNQRHGLTFHHLGDAKKFERLVRQTIQEISPPRGSQSEEEEIFVQSDSLLLECEAPLQPQIYHHHHDDVPRRPHKPKRLTEEYRSASMENSPEDSSSNDRDSPTGAKNNSGNNSTGSLAANSLIKSSSHMQLDTDKPRPSSTVLSTDPILPPRAIPTAPRTLTPPNVSSSRSAYTDYRNDCYGKQKAQHTSGSKTKLSDIILDNANASKSDMQALADHKIDLEPLESVVNTPKLPRKKRSRRHRTQSLLCCFKAPSLSDEYG